MQAIIAVDTNLLVRYIVRDVPEQAEAADRLLESLTVNEQGYVSREVVIEMVWVLGRSYGFSRVEITNVVLDLVDTESLIVESADDIIGAAVAYARGDGDFADLMILVAAQRAGCETLYTFDRKFARVEGVTLLDTG